MKVSAPHWLFVYLGLTCYCLTQTEAIMTKESQNILDVQQKMMENWLEAWQAMYQPFKEVQAKSTGTKKKGGGKASAAVAEGQAAVVDFTRHWAEAQEMLARKWWEVFQEASWLPGLPAKGARVPYEGEGGFWKKWMSWMESFWPAMDSSDKPIDSRIFMKMYADWLSSWYEMWGSGMKRLSDDNPLISKLFSTDFVRHSLDNTLKLFPADNWKTMLDSMQALQEQNVAFWNDIDLPFDEIAAFWDRMMVRFTPLEDTQLFTLGNQANQYLEVLVNPFFAIAGTPRLAQITKLGRLVQFHYYSFLIKNAELRSKVLEASLAVWPETVKNLLEELETEKTVKLDADFFRVFMASLEERIGRLMKSDEYASVQNELSEIGVRLKAGLDDWFELMLSGMPVLTKSDEDDIAKELEALRVKVRQLSQEQKKEPREKLVKSESMN